MRILFVYETGGDPFGPDGIRVAHSCAGRELSMCREMTRLGHQVDCVVLCPESNDSAFLQARPVSLPDVRPDEYDMIILCNNPAYYHWVALRGDDAELRRHRNVRMWLDGIDEVIMDRLGFVAVFAVPTPILAAAVAARFYSSRVLLYRWGADRIDRDIPDPYAGAATNERLFFCGIVLPQHLAMLRDIGQAGFTTWLVGLFHATVTGGSGLRGMNDEERRRLLPDRVRLVSDFTTPYDIGYQHGPVRYGAFWPYVRHASCCLCFAAAEPDCGSDIYTVRSKISDYLACGTPVVSEYGHANAGDVLWYSAGQVVGYGDSYEFIAAVGRELLIARDRARIADQFHAQQGWHVAVRQMLE
jgi:hypothetical protein